MDERRKAQRHRTLKGGHIVFNRAAAIDCRVRNISPVGACLEVESQLGVPGAFTLVVEIDRMQQFCRVVWRAERRLGVVFTDATAA